MNVENSKIEIIDLEQSIKVVGINLQKSGLPITFESLGKMWENYSEEIKSKTPNRLDNDTEYGICLNKIPDYIVGVEVDEIVAELQQYFGYEIASGKYVKASFSAETHEILVSSQLMKAQKEAKKWAKDNSIKCNPEYTVEVYPKLSSSMEYPWMYILIPIK